MSTRSLPPNSNSNNDNDVAAPLLLSIAEASHQHHQRNSNQRPLQDDDDPFSLTPTKKKKEAVTSPLADDDFASSYHSPSMTSPVYNLNATVPAPATAAGGGLSLDDDDDALLYGGGSHPPPAAAATTSAAGGSILMSHSPFDTTNSAAAGTSDDISMPTTVRRAASTRMSISDPSDPRHPSQQQQTQQVLSPLSALDPVNGSSGTGTRARRISPTAAEQIVNEHNVELGAPSSTRASASTSMGPAAVASGGAAASGAAYVPPLQPVSLGTPAMAAPPLSAGITSPSNGSKTMSSPPSSSAAMRPTLPRVTPLASDRRSCLVNGDGRRRGDHVAFDNLLLAIVNPLSGERSAAAGLVVSLKSVIGEDRVFALSAESFRDDSGLRRALEGRYGAMMSQHTSRCADGVDACGAAASAATTPAESLHLGSHCFDGATPDRRPSIVVAGGDGTVAWVLNVLESMYAAEAAVHQFALSAVDVEHRIDQQVAQSQIQHALETRPQAAAAPPAAAAAMTAAGHGAGLGPNHDTRDVNAALAALEDAHAALDARDAAAARRHLSAARHLCRDDTWVQMQRSRRTVRLPRAVPAIAVIPLGTGNDLSNSLGCGLGFSTNKVAPFCVCLPNDVEHILRTSLCAPVISFDRWRVTISKVEYDLTGGAQVGAGVRTAGSPAAADRAPLLAGGADGSTPLGASGTSAAAAAATAAANLNDYMASPDVAVETRVRLTGTEAQRRLALQRPDTVNTMSTSQPVDSFSSGPISPAMTMEGQTASMSIAPPNAVSAAAADRVRDAHATLMQSRDWTPRLLREFTFNNYVSFGLDAGMIFEFDKYRQKYPKLHTHRFMNKAWYGLHALSQVARSYSFNNQALAMACDGQEVGLLGGSSAECKAVIVTNVTTYSGGVDLWRLKRPTRFTQPTGISYVPAAQPYAALSPARFGGPGVAGAAGGMDGVAPSSGYNSARATSPATSTTYPPPHLRPVIGSRETILQPKSMSDGLVEVQTAAGLTHLTLTRSGVRATPVGQASHATFVVGANRTPGAMASTMEKHRWGKGRTLYVQADGEPAFKMDCGDGPYILDVTRCAEHAYFHQVLANE